MPSTIRHPKYPGALVKDEVEPGLPFKWFGRDIDGVIFVKTGVFSSHAREDELGEHVIILSFHDDDGKLGPEQEASLIDLGILPNSEGIWRECTTVSTENDE